MIQTFRRKHILITGSLILALLIAGTLTLALHRNPTKPAATHTARATASSPKSSKKSITPNNTAQSSSIIENTSDADKQAANAGSSTPVTNACALLTINIAKQVVGASARTTASSDASSLQASDTSVTACAYSSQNGSVQLVIRKATGHLGVSENDIKFGSDKPADAVAVQGYGQAAYWDPNQHTLNVLGDNNWYIITRSTSTQTDAETVANLLAPGF